VNQTGARARFEGSLDIYHAPSGRLAAAACARSTIDFARGS
jgi:hypothetical protein